jgi:hypothetical protein
MNTDSTKYTPTVKVTMVLNKSQEVDMAKWKCTIHGEERLVTCQTVSFYTIGTISEAMLTVNPKELISVEFKQ